MAFKIETNKQITKKDAKFDLNQVLKKEITLFGASFSSKKKEALYTELSVLLKAGLSLKEGLELIEDAYKKDKDKKVILNLLDLLLSGASFSNAMQADKTFTEYEFYSVKIGEETGRLQEVCKELGLFFSGKNTQRRNVINALSYPVIVLTTAFFAILFMLQFVVPMFENIFKQNNVELPFLTLVIVRISEFFKDYSWMLLLGIVLLFVAAKVFRKKAWYQRYSTVFIQKIPFVGSLIKIMYLAQFTQATALLTSAKVPMLHSIELTKKMIPFYPLQTALASVEKELIKGRSLSESLRPFPVFDRRMVALVRVAEETNQNQFIFERLTTQYNDDIQQQSKLLTTILEPLIIIVLGAIVAVILVAMYLPMFKLSTVIG